MNRLAPFVLLLALPLAARTIDVTAADLAGVHPDAKIAVTFSVANYGFNNGGHSPYPTSLGLQLLMQDPGGARDLVPGTGQEFYIGYGFDARLESLDGSQSVPLYDPLADRLGLDFGHLVIVPGLYEAAGASQPVSVLYGTAALTAAQSEALFGSGFTARFVLRNTGRNVTLGIGSDYTVRNAVFIPDVAGFGPAHVSGMPRSVVVSNPEPSTWMLAAGAAALLLLRSRGALGARVRRHGRSRV